MNDSSYNAETIAERRKFARYQMSLKVHYTKTDSAMSSDEKSESISRDLGIGGVAIIVEEALDVGQIVNVEIALPNVEDILSGEQDLMSLSAVEKRIVLLSKVVWCRAESDQRFLAGVQFLDSEKEDAQFLKSFLEEYSLKDSTKA